MLKIISLELLDIYQRHLSFLLPSNCRFVPTCSEYCRQAILRYGFFKGLIKATKRLLMCHPFSEKTGYDPLV